MVFEGDAAVGLAALPGIRLWLLSNKVHQESNHAREQSFSCSKDRQSLKV
jgi:hypothetical protein